jgi:hypothetical protein
MLVEQCLVGAGGGGDHWALQNENYNTVFLSLVTALKTLTSAGSFETDVTCTFLSMSNTG